MVNRELTVKATLSVDNRLSPELNRAKADADATAAAVDKIAKGRMGAGGAGVQTAPTAPVSPGPMPQAWFGDSSVRARMEEMRRRAEPTPLPRVPVAPAADNPLTSVSMDEYRMASRLARAHTIVGLASAAMATTGAGGGSELGQVAGSALSGGAAGAFFGPQGAVIGAAIGGTAAVFKVIQEGADKAKQAAEQFKAAATAAANAIVSSETSIRRLRETGRITESELAGSAGRFAESILRRREEDRPGAAAAALPAARAELERLHGLTELPAARAPHGLFDAADEFSTAGGMFAPFTRALSESLGSRISPTTTPAEVRAAELAVTALETASRGIERDRTPTTFGDVGAVRERIMTDISGASGAPERTAEAVAAIRAHLERWGLSAAMIERMMRPPEPPPV